MTDSLEVEEHPAGDEEGDEAEGVAAHVDDLGVVGVGGGGGCGGGCGGGLVERGAVVVVGRGPTAVRVAEAGRVACNQTMSTSVHEAIMYRVILVVSDWVMLTQFRLRITSK